MKLYTPIISLIKKAGNNGSQEYFLHAVTLIDSNIFKAEGFQISSSAEGLNVDLLIDRDPAIDHLGVISPVAHTVPLGTLAGDGTKIQVTVKFQDRLVGRSTTEDDNAEEDDKPQPPFI